MTTQKTVFGHNSTELHFYPVMGGDSESASKNTSDSTILIPIYSNLKNLKFLLASDLVLAGVLGSGILTTKHSDWKENAI